MTGRGWDVGDLGSWVRLPWLAHDEAPGLYITIPQYWSNKTKQHTLMICLSDWQNAIVLGYGRNLILTLVTGKNFGA